MWITESWQKDANPLQGSHLAFRREYNLSSRPISAWIAITASAKYFLWVNGEFVDSGPSRCYPDSQIYDKLDIANSLRIGRNVLALIVQRPSGITGYSLTHRMGLLVDGTIECEDGSVPILTGSDWKVREADWYLTTPYLCSIPLGFQEHFDGTKEPVDWKTVSQLALDGWKNAFCLGGAGTPPWKNLVPATTSKNIETPIQPRLCWQGRASREMLDMRFHNLARFFDQQTLRGTSVTAAISPEILSTSSDNVFVFDFGKTRFIRPGVEMINLSGAVRFELFYGLALEERPRAMMGFDGENEGFCDSFTPGSVNTRWEGLSPRGFRYLTVKITGDGQVSFKLKTSAIDYPYPQHNQFICNDTFIQEVWETSLETLRSATTDVIGEPARENVLWTFDACVGGKAAYYSFGDSDMWKHCLGLVAQGIDQDGLPNAVVPAGYSFMVLIDQSLYWVISCHEYYWATGDQEFLGQLLPAIERLLGFCHRHLTEDGLFIPPSYAWHWIDWAPLNREPYSMPINALLLLAAQAARSLAEEFACTCESLKKSSTDLVETLNQTLLLFFDPVENCFRSHIPAGGEFSVCSINQSTPVEYDLHSNALACRAQLGSTQQRDGAMEKMIQILMEAKENITSMDDQVFGIAWTELILEPFIRHGRGQEALQVLRRYFKPFLDLHTSTWGEDFVPNIYNTAHGWGACVNSLIIEGLCGIQPLAAGWTKLRVTPSLPENLNVQYCFQTNLGEIHYQATDGHHFLQAPSGVEIQTGKTSFISNSLRVEI